MERMGAILAVFFYSKYLPWFLRCTGKIASKEDMAIKHFPSPIYIGQLHAGFYLHLDEVLFI